MGCNGTCSRKWWNNEVQDFFYFEKFKDNAVKISDDMKKLTDESFLVLYNIYLRNCKLYVIGLIEDVNNKHFCTEEEKKVYMIAKKCHLKIISSMGVIADDIKNGIKSKKSIEDVKKKHEESMKDLWKFTNYDQWKAKIDYSKKIFERKTINLSEEELRKILKKNGWPEQ